MAEENPTTIKVGDHRYLQGLPITIVHQPWEGCWYYVHGHVDIEMVTLSQMLPKQPTDPQLKKAYLR